MMKWLWLLPVMYVVYYTASLAIIEWRHNHNKIGGAAVFSLLLIMAGIASFLLWTA